MVYIDGKNFSLKRPFIGVKFWLAHTEFGRASELTGVAVILWRLTWLKVLPTLTASGLSILQLTIFHATDNTSGQAFTANAI